MWVFGGHAWTQRSERLTQARTVAAAVSELVHLKSLICAEAVQQACGSHHLNCLDLQEKTENYLK